MDETAYRLQYFASCSCVVSLLQAAANAKVVQDASLRSVASLAVKAARATRSSPGALCLRGKVPLEERGRLADRARVVEAQVGQMEKLLVDHSVSSESDENVQSDFAGANALAASLLDDLLNEINRLGRVVEGIGAIKKNESSKRKAAAKPFAKSKAT